MRPHFELVGAAATFLNVDEDPAHTPISVKHAGHFHLYFRPNIMPHVFCQQSSTHAQMCMTIVPHVTFRPACRHSHGLWCTNRNTAFLKMKGFQNLMKSKPAPVAAPLQFPIPRPAEDVQLVIRVCTPAIFAGTMNAGCGTCSHRHSVSKQQSGPLEEWGELVQRPHRE
jgi:hypothetical protein